MMVSDGQGWVMIFNNGCNDGQSFKFQMLMLKLLIWFKVMRWLMVQLC